MASEITASATINLTRTTQLANWVTGSLTLNQTGLRTNEAIITATTTGTVIPLAAGTAGYTLIQNLDTNDGNYCGIITTSAGLEMIKLNAQEIALFKMGAGVTAPYAKMASTAASVHILSLEL